VWRLIGFNARDRAGNVRSIFGSTLVALGFTTSIEVRGVEGGDTTPPRLRAVSVDPGTVEVSTEDAMVAVTATITNTASGVEDCCVFLNFRSPSGNAIVTASLQRTSGDEFSGTLRIAARSESGLWRLVGFNARDRAGNTRSIFGSTLVALGFTTSIEVRGIEGGDTTPPRLRAVSLDPGAVDVSAEDAFVAVTAKVTDAGSGVEDCCVSLTFRSPSGGVFAGASLRHSSGDEFSGTMRVPARSESGLWKLFVFIARDRAGNVRSISGSTLVALGFTTSLRVGNAPDPPATDLVPPRLGSLRVEPLSVDVSGGPATLAVSATITDETGLSGCCPILGFRSPSGAQSVSGFLLRTGGDEFAGSVQVPQGAEPGLWRLDTFQLSDVVGNFVFLTRLDLADLGFELSVEVIGPAREPDFAPPRLGSLRVEPSSVDVTAGPATLAVSATITDESGLGDCCPSFVFRSPSGAQAVSGLLLRTGGGDEFAGWVQVPQGAEPGPWRMDSFQVADVVGNFVFLTRFDLADLGFEPRIEVTGPAREPDFAPPRLEALRVEPSSVDVSGGPATLAVSATITDETGLSGCCPSFVFRSPSGARSVSGFLLRTGGDEFAGSVQVPQGAEPGLWRMDSFQVGDVVGNFVFLTRFDLADLGFEPSVEVTANAPPHVDAGPDQTVNEGDRLEVQASFSDANAGDTHTATIDWGDGSPAEPGTVDADKVSGSHAYVDDGAYTAILTVTDNDGASGSDTVSVTVANVPPSASAGGPYEGTPLAAVTFSAAATDPGARDTLEYAWDFDYRGTFTADAVAVDLNRPSHTYVFPGAYTVALQVRDDDGGVSQIATAAVSIQPPTSTNAHVTGSVRWSRDVATLLELHADGGRVWGQARFEGDGRSITATELVAIVVTGDDVIVFARSADDVLRIDAHDGGNPGTGDTYRLRLASGYDSGVLERATGNLVIHRAP
jgi:PKD repeat protein